jgi:hypothetical protein
MLETGRAADLARKFNLGRARVTQVLDDALLAPDIQVEILRVPLVEPSTDALAERRVRVVVREVLREDHRRLWRALLEDYRWPEATT